MRDSERVRRSQSGVLLGLGVGLTACAIVWLALVVVERASGWSAPWHPSAVAGLIAAAFMLGAARWGSR
jgi:hypothetical protein